MSNPEAQPFQGALGSWEVKLADPLGNSLMSSVFIGLWYPPCTSLREYGHKDCRLASGSVYGFKYMTLNFDCYIFSCKILSENPGFPFNSFT
jgi:hypothetical protein